MKFRSLLAALLGVLMLLPLQARDKEAPKEKEDPAHEELRALRKQLVEVVNKGDIDGLMELLDKDVVVTWLDGRVSRGRKRCATTSTRCSRDRIGKSSATKPIPKSRN